MHILEASVLCNLTRRAEEASVAALAREELANPGPWLGYFLRFVAAILVVAMVAAVLSAGG